MATKRKHNKLTGGDNLNNNKKKKQRIKENEEINLTSVTAIAYPTIPIIFLSSIDPNTRQPLHDTMGLAVTDKYNNKRTETKIEIIKNKENNNKDLEFYVNGEELDILRLKQVKEVIHYFILKSKRHDSLDNNNICLRITSTNHCIFSGSSDAGAAALVIALDKLFQTHFSKAKLANLANQISESAIRSLYGGLSLLAISPSFHPLQLASPKKLSSLTIFALEFNYKNRISANEIFDICRIHPCFKTRLNMIKTWMKSILKFLSINDYNNFLSIAEENCHNAHYMIESSGKRCRKREMLNACLDIEEMRKDGYDIYWTAGGGNVLNLFTHTNNNQSNEILQELKRRGHNPNILQVACGAFIKEYY